MTKKTSFFILFIILSYRIIGQNFVGNQIELYNGKTLKVLPKKESAQKYGFDCFYSDSNLTSKYACCESYNSKYSSLVNKEFKILDITAYESKYLGKKYKFKIENSEIGIIFFDYDPKFEHKFPFEVVGGLSLPNDFYCKEITSSYDKFTNETIYQTNSKGISFSKFVKENSPMFLMSITQPGAMYTIGKKGLIILLENNKRLEKPEAEIKANQNDYGGYYNTTTIELNQEDIKLLCGNKITDLRLYLTDSEVENPQQYCELLKCLIK
jgi:hypothetical protein